MKKILILLIVLFVSVIKVSAQAEIGRNYLSRSVIDLNRNQHTLKIATEAEIEKIYPRGLPQSIIAVKIMGGAGNFKVFQCTKEEYKFLQKKLKKQSFQIILDDDEFFLGFIKIMYY